MNRKVLILLIVTIGLLLVGGGVFAYTNNQNQKQEQEQMTMNQNANNEAMMSNQQSATMENEVQSMDQDKNTNTTKSGAYVTLSDYTSNPSAYTDSKKVYFFHAGWCSICQSIDKDITSDITQIPAGVTIIKTDFDSATDLRKKYGVTTQYTFVQVDNSGNETKQWSATSLETAINGIES